MCLECGGLLKPPCACEVGTHRLLPMPMRVTGLRGKLMQLGRNLGMQYVYVLACVQTI